jgi:DNA-binding beta-propeller fold protein YncE
MARNSKCNPARGYRGAGLVLLLVFAALVGCSTRERTNPLDPQNPETGGTPAGFTAFARNQLVELRWFPLAVPGLQGYELSRRASGESSFSPVGPGSFPPDAGGFDDATVQNDTTYAYHLTFILEDGSRSDPVEKLARPGPAAIWVGDAGGDLVVRLAPDGRERLFSLIGLNNPVAVEVEPIQGRVWGASAFENFVAVWNSDGSFVGVNGRVGAPSGLAPLPSQNLAWMTDEQQGELILADAVGTIITLVPGFLRPADVAFDDSRSLAWVTDRDAKSLHAIDMSGNAVVDVAVSGRPWKIAVDSAQGDIWVTYTEDGFVERRAADGSLLARLDNLARPFSIATDGGRQRVWVTLANGNAVLRLGLGGQVERRVEGITEPRGVAVDARNGEVWVTTLGEGDGKGSVLRLSSEGVIESEFKGLVRPFTIAVDSFVN